LETIYLNGVLLFWVIIFEYKCEFFDFKITIYSLREIKMFEYDFRTTDFIIKMIEHESGVMNLMMTIIEHELGRIDFTGHPALSAVTFPMSRNIQNK
jgi:hypothetical protein